nr:MAG TPA: endonuclease [Caudoviricetes sp.]
MLKTYEYRLYPNIAQEAKIQQHFGCTRYVYNKALELKISTYEKDKTNLSKYDLAKLVTQWKTQDDTLWLKEVNAQALQQSIFHLDNAYKNFFREKRGFPKFKSKHNHRQAYSLPQGIKINFDNHKIYVPKVGWVNAKIDRTFEGIIRTCTVKQVPSGKYFISVLFEDDTQDKPLKAITRDTTIGIDLGVKDFCTLSTGEKVSNPKVLSKYLSKLAIEQQKLSRKQKGSRNREKQRVKVARVHEKISNIRKDFLHKLSTRLTNDSQISALCLETLNIKEMLQNRALARSISDVSWYSFVQMLEYKAKRNGVNILRIGQYEPSSKLCTCGYINHGLKLSDRVWTCPKCGATHDRDILASNNIKDIALSNTNLDYHFSGLGKSEVLV